MNVYSHRRSGTHLLMQHLQRCFGIETVKRHLDPEDLENTIYIVRDGRDVMTSCYHWWCSSGESRVCNIMKEFEGRSFSEFLSGTKIPDYKTEGEGNVRPVEIDRGLLSDPIKFWVDHVTDAIINKKYVFVRYENIVNDPETVLTAVSKKFNLEFIQKPKHIRKLVGHHPRKGIINDYKNIFLKEDMIFFDLKAGHLMETLGYYE